MIGRAIGGQVGYGMGAAVSGHVGAPQSLGASLWLDPGTGATGSTWTDKVAGITLTPIGTPVYHAANSNLGGRPGWRLTATDSLVSAGVFGPTAAGPLTIFCQHYVAGTGAYQWICGLSNTAAGSSTVPHIGSFKSIANKYYCQARNDAATVRFTNPDSTETLPAANSWSYIRDDLTAFNVTSPVATTTVGGGAVARPLSATVLKLGGHATWPGAMDIGHVVVFRRYLSGADKQAFEAWANGLIS